ncbi:MAG: hypothetical protein ABI856_19295 [Nitrospira sp.]
MRRTCRLIMFLCSSLWISIPLAAIPTIAAPPNVEPCSLLTTFEVEQVVGPLKGKPTGDKEGDATWCNYEFANGKDLMEVWVFPADAINRGRKVSKKPVAVKGLGDDAFMDRGMHGIDYVNLFIKKGAVTVKLSLKETAGDEQKLKSLAQKALGRF